MSYVVGIRRAESQPPFTREELERVAQTHPGLSLGQTVLTWSNGKGDAVELAIGARELRADALPEAAAEQALAVFQRIAQDLDARVVGEEGEDLSLDAPASPSAGPSWSTWLGGLAVAVALPFTLAAALVRLPWIVWRAGKRLR